MHRLATAVRSKAFGAGVIGCEWRAQPGVGGGHRGEGPLDCLHPPTSSCTEGRRSGRAGAPAQADEQGAVVVVVVCRSTWSASPTAAANSTTRCQTRRAMAAACRQRAALNEGAGQEGVPARCVCCVFVSCTLIQQCSRWGARRRRQLMACTPQLPHSKAARNPSMLVPLLCYKSAGCE